MFRINKTFNVYVYIYIYILAAYLFYNPRSIYIYTYIL